MNHSLSIIHPFSALFTDGDRAATLVPGRFSQRVRCVMQQGWRNVLRAGLIIGLVIAGLIAMSGGIQGKSSWSHIALGIALIICALGLVAAWMRPLWFSLRK
jgi:hypothetical protein